MSDGLIKGTFQDMHTDESQLPNSIRPCRIDGTTHALTVIDYAHHETHGGSSYWAYRSATLGNAEVLTIGFTTPNTAKWAHLLMRVDLTAVATLDILEDCTSLSNGAAFTPKNFNRNSTNTSGMTTLVGHTGSDLITPVGGSEIWNETLGTRGLVTTRENATEMIMKQNSIYLFRITNSTSSNQVTFLLSWYEHTNKD